MKRIKIGAMLLSVTVFATGASLVYAEEDTVSETISVACVGDSLTYGQGADDPETESYPALLQNLLGEDYEVENYGKRGHSLTENGVCYREQEVYEETLDAKADIYIIMLGTNDSHPDVWDEELYREDLEDMISDYQEANEQAEIYLMTPPHIYDIDGTAQYEEEADIIDTQLVPIVEEVSGEMETGLIDIWKLTEDHEEWYIEDGMHLNNSGYEAVAQCISEELLNES